MTSTPPRATGSPEEQAWRSWAEEQIRTQSDANESQASRVRAVERAATDAGSVAVTAGAQASSVAQQIVGSDPTNRIARPLSDVAYWSAVQAGARSVFEVRDESGAAVAISSWRNVTATELGLTFQPDGETEGAEANITPILPIPSSRRIYVDTAAHSAALAPEAWIEWRSADGSLVQADLVEDRTSTTAPTDPQVTHYSVRLSRPAGSGVAMTGEPKVFEAIGTGGVAITPGGIVVEDSSGTPVVEISPTSPPLLAPSAPVATPGMGIVQLAWNGKMADGSPAPASFSSLRAEVATTPAGPWSPVGQSLSKAGTISVRAEVGQSRSYRFVATDTVRRESPASASATASASGVSLGDLGIDVSGAIEDATATANSAWDAAASAVTSTSPEYALGSSATTAPTTGWSTTPPARTPGSYIWQRSVVTYGNGSTQTTSAVLVTGNDGSQGPKGDTGAQGPKGDTGSQGLPGAPGADGQPTYTWIKYADTPTTGMSDSPTGKTYMGIAYNKLTPTESSTYSDYEWSLIRGATGATGPKGDQGIPGPAGADGQPTYTWVKYGTSSAGAGMSDDPTGKTYIGLAYNKTTQAESTNPADYQWALIQGPQGATGSTGPKGDTGSPGATGAQGVSVSSVTVYYRTVAAGAAAPAAPTTSTPPSPWAATEPDYAPNTDLYAVTRVGYSNGSFSYTPVSKVSAYTAARQAIQTADGKNTIFPQVAQPTGKAAGDQWWVLSSDGASIVGVKMFNGVDWVPYQIVADSLIAAQSITTPLLKSGSVTTEILDARAVKAGNIDVDALNGQTIKGSYIEAPIIASSPNLGTGANVLNDPQFASTVNTAWVVSGHTGDTSPTQTDTITWDKSKTYPATGWSPSYVERIQGSVVASMSILPIARTAGDVVMDHRTAIFSTAARTQNVSAQINDSNWPTFSYSAYSLAGLAGIAPAAADVSKTTYLTNSATFSLVAGETWTASLSFMRSDPSVTRAWIEVVTTGGSVIWSREIVAGELSSGNPISASFIAPSSTSARFRVKATYTGGGSGIRRLANSGAYVKNSYTPPGVSLFQPYNEDVSGFGVSPIGGLSSYSVDTIDSGWSTYDEGATADMKKMSAKARNRFRLTRAVFAKVQPERGYRIDQDKGFQLFNTSGAMTGRLDGQSNFLAGTLATAESGARVQLSQGQIQWYDQYGNIIEFLDGSDVLALKSGWRDYTPSYSGFTMVGGKFDIARYKVLQGSVTVRFSARIASMTGNPTVYLPVPAYDSLSEVLPGSVTLAPPSGSEVMAYVRKALTDRVTLYYGWPTGNNLYIGNISPTLPFTWGSGGRISATFTYDHG